MRSNALRRCLESLSQKWKFPSEPAVAKVPYLWKAMEFTEYTADCDCAPYRTRITMRAHSTVSAPLIRNAVSKSWGKRKTQQGYTEACAGDALPKTRNST